MEQIKLDINMLSNYKRTQLLSSFICKYNFNGRICCCYYCETIGNEVYGEGCEPVDFRICESCNKDFCLRCVNIEDLDSCVCKDCK